MTIPEPYKLIFNWDGIRYEGEIAFFEKAAFTGPVLSNAAQIAENDSIDLDFTVQNMGSGLFLPQHYYIAKLSWGGVVYRPWGVELNECQLKHLKTGSLKELRDGMKFHIDCSTHEQYIHHKFLVYPSIVVNEHGLELR
jgi:hypothetical protein